MFLFHPARILILAQGASSEDMPEDNYSSTVEDLPTFVLRQIASELDASERTIAAYFLTHLDDDGLISVPLIEIARYFHVPVSKSGSHPDENSTGGTLSVLVPVHLRKH